MYLNSVRYDLLTYPFFKISILYFLMKHDVSTAGSASFFRQGTAPNLGLGTFPENMGVKRNILSEINS